jgi:hypothetical protein
MIGLVLWAARRSFSGVIATAGGAAAIRWVAGRGRGRVGRRRAALRLSLVCVLMFLVALREQGSRQDEERREDYRPALPRHRNHAISDCVHHVLLTPICGMAFPSPS